MIRDLIVSPKRASLAFGTLVLLAAIMVSPQGGAQGRNGLPNADPRIQQQITVLEGESLGHSLRNLADTSLFSWPGFITGNAIPISLPFDKSVGTSDIEGILSNRRFLKVLGDTAALPKEKADALVKAHLEDAWSTGKKEFDAQFRFFENLLVEGAPVTNIGFPTTVGGGGPNVPGCRQLLLALLLIAGNLNLEACKSNVEEITVDAVKRYREYSQVRKVNRANAYTLLRGASQYNRQILGTAFVGVQAKETRQKLQAEKERWQTRELPKFNARATAYDLRWSGLDSVDWSFGKLVVRYLQPIDDTSFNQILEELKISAR
jgi:hypothetical protein